MSAVQVHEVLLVDDHPIVRRGLSQLIQRETDLNVCGECGDVEEALDAVARLSPDIAIVDLGLPGVGGLELIKRLNERHPDVKILVVSMFSEVWYGERALRAGAHGFVMKERATDLIIKAIRHVLSGRVYVCEDLTERLLARMTRPPYDANQSPIEALTDRELEVFRLLGEGLSSKRIAGRLDRSVKTIDSHREHMKKKMGLTSANQLLARAAVWVHEQRAVPSA